MLEFVYRKKKIGNCYHIRTSKGTECKMQNDRRTFRKLDTVSNIKPVNRDLCKICESVYYGKPLEKDIVFRETWEREFVLELESYKY